MSYMLAMYDIRGKQEFIFRTNKLKEIAGGSMIIRDCFRDYLFPAALEIKEGSKGIFTYKDKKGNHKDNCEFTEAGFIEHIKQGYVGEVVYDGGGNFILLFESEKMFQEVTFFFTKEVMKSIGTLKVLATAVPVDNFDDYKSDRDRLYEKHRRNESGESTISPWVSLPISQVDRKTSMPLTNVWSVEKEKNIKVSKESYAKLKKFKEEEDRVKRIEENCKDENCIEELYLNNVKRFDELVSQKGVDSKLAVVYIDGNNMGAAVQEILKRERTYEQCLGRLRKFSSDIQEKYVVQGVNKVVGALSDKKYRIVVAAGDEINFVVRAEDAMKCVQAYMQNLYSEERHDSACAGIAVFHSHAPYSDAYSIAEECCESAKKCMKENGLSDVCLVDFHICQAAIGISLDSIRELEGIDKLSRPWMLAGKTVNNSITRYQDVQKLAELFRLLGRTNIKSLVEAARKEPVALEVELRRIKAHLKDEYLRESGEEPFGKSPKKIDKMIIREQLDQLITEVEKKRYMISDVALSYDIWFSCAGKGEIG